MLGSFDELTHTRLQNLRPNVLLATFYIHVADHTLGRLIQLFYFVESFDPVQPRLNAQLRLTNPKVVSVSAANHSCGTRRGIKVFAFFSFGDFQTAITAGMLNPDESDAQFTLGRLKQLALVTRTINLQKLFCPLNYTCFASVFGELVERQPLCGLTVDMIPQPFHESQPMIWIISVLRKVVACSWIRSLCLLLGWHQSLIITRTPIFPRLYHDLREQSPDGIPSRWPSSTDQVLYLEIRVFYSLPCAQTAIVFFFLVLIQYVPC